MNSSFQTHTLQSKGRLIDFHKPLVMGILNATPDSFYTQSASTHFDELLKKAEAMVAEGADILDVGGMSSRPGAEIISPSKELDRVIPIIEILADLFPDLPISIDTLHAHTADKAIQSGASLINDISGGHHDPEIVDVSAYHRVPFICMHMRGIPATMKDLNEYDDLLRDIMLYFKERISYLRSSGVSDIVLDPGFGFAKNIRQNFQLLDKLNLLQIFDLPVMVGISRKSFVYKTLNGQAEDALNGTTALHALVIQKGVQILRVHDVKAAKEVVLLSEKLNQSLA